VRYARLFLALQEFRDAHPTRACNPREVISNEVGDHHVLGNVLIEKLSTGRGGPLDRAGTKAVFIAGEEQFWTSAHYFAAGDANEPAMGGWISRLQDGVEGSDVRGANHWGAQNPAQIDLIHITAADSLSNHLNPIAILLLIE
jgi:hypothetical protein